MFDFLLFVSASRPVSNDDSRFRLWGYQTEIKPTKHSFYRES